MIKIAMANKFQHIANILIPLLLQNIDCSIVWTANTTEETLQKCLSITPTLLLLDINLPNLGGAKITKEIMEHSKCNILLTTQDINLNASEIFEAMGYGAIDVVNLKNLSFEEDPFFVQNFLKKINMTFHFLGILEPQKYKFSQIESDFSEEKYEVHTSIPPLVVIGASTGGPHAISCVISSFPSNAKFSVVIIQHIDELFIPGFVSWLNDYSNLPVEVALSGTIPKSGVVYVAAKNEHLIINPLKKFEYMKLERDIFYAPSINVFFESLLENWTNPGAAILLTGMGNDGAQGLKKLFEKNWYTVAQNQNSCVVFGMPKNAINMGGVCDTLPLDEIGPRLLSKLGHGLC